MLLDIQKEFLAYLSRTRVHKHGQRWYLETLNEYLSGSGLDIYRLKVKEAQGFQSYLMTLTNPDGSVHYTKGSVSMIITAMRNFYTFLKKKGLVFSNPFLAVRKVKYNGRLLKDVPDEEAVNAFLSKLALFWKFPCAKGDYTKVRAKYYRAHIVAELVYSTGLNSLDVMKLKAEDLDFRRSIVRRDGREYFLNDYARQVLEIYVERMRVVMLSDYHHWKQQGTLFGSKKGLRECVNKVLREEWSKSGQQGMFNIKHLRHAMVLHLLRGGCGIRHLQEILGYKDIQSMRIYLALDKEGLKNVIDKYHPRAINIREEKA